MWLPVELHSWTQTHRRSPVFGQRRFWGFSTQSTYCRCSSRIAAADCPLSPRPADRSWHTPGLDAWNQAPTRVGMPPRKSPLSGSHSARWGRRAAHGGSLRDEQIGRNKTESVPPMIIYRRKLTRAVSARAFEGRRETTQGGLAAHAPPATPPCASYGPVPKNRSVLIGVLIDVPSLHCLPGRDRSAVALERFVGSSLSRSLARDIRYERPVIGPCICDWC